MEALYSFTVNKVMAGFLNRDGDVLQHISALQPESLCNGNWYFTLPQLFNITKKIYLKDKKDTISKWDESYILFRKSLYQNPTNEILMGLGGQVEIFNLNVNHAKTIYVLRRISL